MASAFDPVVLAQFVAAGMKLSEQRLSIIAQEMILTDKSGVVFTIDPASRREDQTAVNCLFGLGEACVSGRVIPDSYHYHWKNGRSYRTVAAHQAEKLVAMPGAGMPVWQPVDQRIRDRARLSKTEVAQLAHLGQRIQAFYGYPVEVEFAIQEDRAFLLQARPITELQPPSTSTRRVWINFPPKDHGISRGPLPRLVWSLRKPRLDHALSSFFAHIGLVLPEPDLGWTTQFYNRCYWNSEALKARLALLPERYERKFDARLGLQPACEGDGARFNPRRLLQGARTSNLFRRLLRLRLRSYPKFMKEHLRGVKRVKQRILGGLNNRDFSNCLREFVTEHYGIMEEASFLQSLLNSGISGMLENSLLRHKDGMDFLALFPGFIDLPRLRQRIDLADIVERVRGDAQSRRYWISTDPEVITEAFQNGEEHHYLSSLDVHIARFGHHSGDGMDIQAPRYSEDPTGLIASIRLLVEGDEFVHPRIRQTTQEALYHAELERLGKVLSRIRWRKVSRQIALVRRSLLWREELLDLSIRGQEQMRRLALEAGRRLLELSYLVDPKDVFHLDFETLLKCLTEEVSRELARRTVFENHRYAECYRNYSP